MHGLAEAAVRYAKRGRAVFPLRPREKTPLTSHGFKDATTNEEKVSAWWQQQPDANIGLATGAMSGFWALDIDSLDGEAALRILEAEHTQLPATVEVITGRGRQLYFRYTALLGCSVRRLGKDLDIRADGGYVVAPPSIHPSGKLYCWSVDGDPSEVGLATAPEWLTSLLAKPEAKSATPPAMWREILASGVDAGGRNQSIARISGYLLRKRVDPFVTLEFCHLWNQARCRPPLDENEIAKTVDSIAARELARRGGASA